MQITCNNVPFNENVNVHITTNYIKAQFAKNMLQESKQSINFFQKHGDSNKAYDD